MFFSNTTGETNDACSTSGGTKAACLGLSQCSVKAGGTNSGCAIPAAQASRAACLGASTDSVANACVYNGCKFTPAYAFSTCRTPPNELSSMSFCAGSPETCQAGAASDSQAACNAASTTADPCTWMASPSHICKKMTLKACEQLCQSNEACAHVSFSDATDGGNCHLYAADQCTTTIPMAGTWTIINGGWCSGSISSFTAVPGIWKFDVTDTECRTVCAEDVNCDAVNYAPSLPWHSGQTNFCKMYGVQIESKVGWTDSVGSLETWPDTGIVIVPTDFVMTCAVPPQAAWCSVPTTERQYPAFDGTKKVRTKKQQHRERHQVAEKRSRTGYQKREKTYSKRTRTYQKRVKQYRRQNCAASSWGSCDRYGAWYYTSNECSWYESCNGGTAIWAGWTTGECSVGTVTTGSCQERPVWPAWTAGECSLGTVTYGSCQERSAWPAWTTGECSVGTQTLGSCQERPVWPAWTAGDCAVTARVAGSCQERNVWDPWPIWTDDTNGACPNGGAVLGLISSFVGGVATECEDRAAASPVLYSEQWNPWSSATTTSGQCTQSDHGITDSTVISSIHEGCMNVDPSYAAGELLITHRAIDLSLVLLLLLAND